MKREHRMRCLGISLAALGFIFVTVAAAASRYTDLRNVEPIRGDVAEGAKKAVVCFACHGANGTPCVADRTHRSTNPATIAVGGGLGRSEIDARKPRRWHMV